MARSSKKALSAPARVRGVIVRSAVRGGKVSKVEAINIKQTVVRDS